MGTLDTTSGNKPARAPNGQLLPGNTANPDGRPKGSVSVVEAIKRKLEEIDPEEKKTYLELFVNKVFKTAIKNGDVSMMRDIISRIDGMPRQTVVLDDPTSRLFEMKNYVNETIQPEGIQHVDSVVSPKPKK
jgi:hypothetical protein